MEPSKKTNKKWIIFGTIIAVLAILVLIGPIFISQYMKNKYMKPNIVKSELMIKVKGELKQSLDGKTLYLAGQNGLFYVLFGEQSTEIAKNIDKTATVFGNIYEPHKDEQIDGSPVRMRINVVNIDYPESEEKQD